MPILAEQRYELLERSAALPPHAPGSRVAVTRRQVAEIDVRLLHDERGARCGAAAPDALSLEQDHADPGAREEMRREAARDAPADDHDLGLVTSVHRRKSRRTPLVSIRASSSCRRAAWELNSRLRFQGSGLKAQGSSAQGSRIAYGKGIETDG